MIKLSKRATESTSRTKGSFRELKHPEVRIVLTCSFHTISTPLKEKDSTSFHAPFYSIIIFLMVIPIKAATKKLARPGGVLEAYIASGIDVLSLAH